MPLTEAQTRARIKYAQKTYQRIPLDVRKDHYQDIKSAAEAHGESVNEFVKKAIDARLEGDW